MSVADGLATGNPLVAIGTALYRGIVGAGPRHFFRDNINRILAQAEAQRAAAAPPASSSSSSSSGTLRTVIDNSPTRPRTPGGPGYRPPSWQVSPLPGPWIPPETDQEYEDFERDTNARWRGFVGPVPTIPDTLPRTLPRTVPQTIPGTVARVLARAVALPWLIFYPSRTADDDTIPGPMPQPIPPRGPSRRPRVRTVPRAPTVPGPYRPAQPRFPSDFERDPVQNPDTVSYPAPGTLPKPAPAPSPAPAQRPRSPRLPAPAPTPTPIGLPFWVPLLPQLLPRVPSRLPNRPLAAPLTPFQPARVEYPQPQPFALPLQARPSNCPPCEQQRKRKRRTCTNRITNRRTFTRGGAKYRSITRKLEC